MGEKSTEEAKLAEIKSEITSAALHLIILEELQYCVGYAGARADGAINGEDLLEAIARRKKELSK
jgi:ATP:corrinoid adenosyltransferase